MLKPITTALSTIFQGYVLKSQYFRPLTAYIFVPKHLNVQFSPVTQSCLTLCYPWTAAHQASLSITNSQSLLRLMFIELVMLTISSSVIPFSSCLQSFPASESLPSESVLHIRFSFSFSISPSSEYSGLISFRIDWFDLFAVQGTGLSKVFSNTTVEKYQFFDAQLSLWSNSHIHT